MAGELAADAASSDGQGHLPARSGAHIVEGTVQRWAAALLGRRGFWAFFLVVAFGWPLVRVARTALPAPLPVLGTIGSFELVDQGGRRYGTADLKGRVWLASAIRTASPSSSELATELGKVQHRVRNLGPAFHLVTVGIDPEKDTPTSLVEFSTHRRVSPRLWSFLSGDNESLAKAQDALGLRSQSAGGDGSHGGALASAGPLTVALVDAEMRVRGRYDLADGTAIDTLLYHVGLLVNRGD
jgi:protein SCO1